MTMQTNEFDALTAEDLRGALGVKWSSYPDCVGAFIAEMDFKTAPVVQDALRKAVDAGFFGYLPSCLEEDLQRAVANWYDRHTDWSVQPEMVHSMPDVLKGLEIMLNFYATGGGKVIVPTPSYMPFLLVPKACRREILQVPMLETGNGWEYDFDAIERAFADDGADVFIHCNPFNPIGRVVRRDEHEKICDIVDRYNGRVFADEIHAPMIFAGQEHIPYASISEKAANHTLTAIACSKGWNIAGLKCAQMVISNEADQDIYKNGGAMWAAHGASSLGVVASIAAYNEGDEWLGDIMEYLDGNRRYLAELIEQHMHNVRYRIPEGTYLAWLDMKATRVPEDVGTFFREKAHVAINDGAACGEVGKRCVRFNFAMGREMMASTIEAMGKALAELENKAES